jgi:alpha-tubulin suppressor-like RCC1 family protein
MNARILPALSGLAILTLVVACGEESGSPTAPQAEPAVAAAVAPAFRQVSAGRDHSCGVTTDDHAFCWGANWQGGLGDGTTVQRLAPVAVAGGHRFLQVSAGYGYS